MHGMFRKPLADAHDSQLTSHLFNAERPSTQACPRARPADRLSPAVDTAIARNKKNRVEACLRQQASTTCATAPLCNQ